MFCDQRPDPDSPVWMLREFDHTRRQASCALFSDLALQDPAQHFMLFFIARGTDEGQPRSQRELAVKLRLSPATVTATLSALEKRGLIRRTPDPADMRVKRVEITDAGRQEAQECRRRMKLLEEAMFSGFSPEELAQLNEYFSRMSRNLKALEPRKKEGD